MSRLQKQGKRIASAVAALTVFVVIVNAAQNYRSQMYIRSLAMGSSENRRVSIPRDQRANYKAQLNQVSRLWMQREKKDIAAALLPFLDSPFERVRNNAARALGRLESPLGLKPLQNKLKALQNPAAGENAESDKPVNALVAMMALARTEARQDSGEQKINAVLSTLHLSWKDFVAMTERSQTKAGSSKYEMDITREILDILYQMAKQGKDINPWQSQLSLSKPQKIYLQGASLSREKEILQTLHYSSELEVVKADDEWLSSQVVAMGDVVRPQLAEALREAANDPRRKSPDEQADKLLTGTSNWNGVTELIRIASYVGGEEVMKALQPFLTGPNIQLRVEAETAIRNIKTAEPTIVPLLP